VPTVAALHRLSQRGVAVHFVLGNHDFAFHPDLAAELGVVVHSSLSGWLGGVHLFAAHGDQALGSRRYDAYHRFLRGRAFNLALRMGGEQRAWRLLGRLAGSPETQGSCPAGVTQALQDYARQRLADGAQLVVLGHSHVPERHDWPEGSYLNAGSFRDQGSYLRLHQGQASLERI